jgi:hypothetical protein
MTDDPEKIAKKARKAAKKMRKAREELRAAKAEMRAARHAERAERGDPERGPRPHRGNGPHIRVETCDGVREFEIPEELRRKGRDFARTVTGPLVRDLAAAGLIAAGAAMAAKAHRKKDAAGADAANGAASDSDDAAPDGEAPDVEAAAEDLSKSADELGQALNALANAALSKFFGPKGAR